MARRYVVAYPLPWKTAAAIAIAGVATLAIAVLPLRTRLFRVMGQALVIDSALEPADVIVVSIAGDTPQVVEAADLVDAGYATRVAVVNDPYPDLEAEFARRGAIFEDPTTIAVRQLHSIGVKNVEVISGAVQGSEDEGRLLPFWAMQNRFRTVIVVTPRDHSRRIARILRRASARTSLRFVVRGARQSVFDPNSWWQSRTATRIETIEIQKLVFDILRHPVS